MPQKFGGTVCFIDRDDINTDEIIPAKYLTEISKKALGPHLLEDLKLEDFDPRALKKAQVIITRSNFGCGSSREHAVWAFEVNDIKVIIGESFARIFRQNCFNCGILAIELPKKEINNLFNTGFYDEGSQILINTDLNSLQLATNGMTTYSEPVPFTLNDFDRSLIEAGGWLKYANKNY